MKSMRKIFAATAAAATMFAGLAIGASTASAAEGDEITISSSKQFRPTLVVRSEAGSPDTVNGHTFTAVRVGYYTKAIEGAAPNGANGRFAQSVEVATDATTAGNSDTRAIMNDILKSLDEDPNTGGAQNGYVGSEYETANNPMGYVVANYAGYGTTSKDTTSATKPWAGLLRDFVTKLNANADFQALVAKGKSDYNNVYLGTGAITDETNQVAEAYIEAGLNKDDKPAVPQGVYVIVDTTDGTGNLPMLTGTKLAGTAGTSATIANFDVLGNTDAGLDLGTVVVKDASLQLSNQVALVNSDGSLNGDYADGVTAEPGQLVRYKLTSSIPSEGLNCETPQCPSADVFNYHLLDLPGAGQTVIVEGGQNPTDDDGNVLFNGTVPMASMKFNYVNADGTLGYYEAHLNTYEEWENNKIGQYQVNLWSDKANKFGTGKTDGIVNEPVGGYPLKSLVANGTTENLYIGVPSWSGMQSHLPEGATWTNVTFEYSAVVTAESGDVTNAFRMYKSAKDEANDTYSKAVSSAVHVEAKQSSITELPLTGGAGLAAFVAVMVALLGVAVFGANRYRSNRRSLRA